MIFNFRKRELHIQMKERQIQKAKRELHSKIEQDKHSVEALNRVLANGITLEVYKATGGRHAR